MKRLRIFPLLIIALFIGCGPKVERTVDQNKTWTENYLNKHIQAVYFDSGKVSFITDGGIGVSDEGTHWRNEFSLVKGQRFQSQSDHHATSTFELREVKPTGVVLKYSNRFDHASFGKRLITIDEGEIELSYRSEH